MATKTQKYAMDLQDMRGFLYSMVSAFTKAIDERTPYNASHTMQVANYVQGLLDFMRERSKAAGETPVFSSEEEDQIVMAAYLHDVGKLVTPLEVMNKANRLGREGMERIHERYLLLKAYLDIEHLEGRMETEDWQKQEDELDRLEEAIGEANEKPVLLPEEVEYFKEMGKRSFRGRDGMAIPWLTASEIRNLKIKKGTLNEGERKVMEYHAVATEKILKEIHFGKHYDKVPEIAAAHHEFLDGSGYPKGLSGEQIPLGARVLTIVDIYDSLVAPDRPYKKARDKHTAKKILLRMVREGKLDQKFTELFCEYVETLSAGSGGNRAGIILCLPQHLQNR